MRNFRKFSALGVIGLMGIAAPAFAVEPSDTPGNRAAPPGESQQDPRLRNDQDRIAGKVIRIDREEGLVALATEEGVVVVHAPPQALETINVGDIVSVPRSVAEPPSASPRE
jgi:hypothetical protein